MEKNMQPTVGRLQKIALKEVFVHEARGFTPWLAQNIDVLSDALNLPGLRVVETEKTVGSFSLDILAEDGAGEPVIIENQIYQTDHDHLGKVLTYLTNLNAKTAIWISSDPRPEHIRAMAWLNESSPADVSFYLVRLEAYRIGDSPAAPMFSRIVEPSPEAKQIGAEKEQLAQRHLDRKEFWAQLLSQAKLKTSLHSHVSPSKENFLGASGGVSGLTYYYTILMNDARVELYIDRGSEAEGQNKAIFDALLDRQPEIERSFGLPLHWERLEDKRACRVSYSLGVGGLRNRDQWTMIADSMVNAMIQLHKSIGGLAEAAAQKVRNV
jgi:hypothetical protein